jgi:hypothetical protein
MTEPQASGGVGWVSTSRRRASTSRTFQYNALTGAMLPRRIPGGIPSSTGLHMPLQDRPSERLRGKNKVIFGSKYHQRALVMLEFVCELELVPVFHLVLCFVEMGWLVERDDGNELGGNALRVLELLRYASFCQRWAFWLEVRGQRTMTSD